MTRGLVPEMLEINAAVPPRYCLYASLDDMYMSILVHVSGDWPIESARLTQLPEATGD
jgi:hypothetical protein